MPFGEVFKSGNRSSIMDIGILPFPLISGKNNNDNYEAPFVKILANFYLFSIFLYNGQPSRKFIYKQVWKILSTVQ